jgi:hypothetical protein
MPPHWFRPIKTDSPTEVADQTAQEGEGLQRHLCKLKSTDGKRHYEIVVSEEQPDGGIFLVNDDLVPE